MTLAQKTDEDRNSLVPLVDLGNNICLNRRYDLLVEGKQVLLFYVNPLEQKIIMTMIDIKDLKH